MRAAATAPADDITFAHSFAGFVAGIVSLATFGTLTLALTLAKAPLTFACSVGWFVAQTLPYLPKLGAWAPFGLAFWCVGLGVVVALVALAIPLSCFAKATAAALWPAYIATGQLRYAFGGARRRRDGT